MIYPVVIKEYRVIDIDAASEEEALEKVRSQLDIRSTAELSIAKETYFDEEMQCYITTNVNLIKEETNV